MNRCPLCQSAREAVFRATVLRKYEVDYFYCDCCGLLQTEKPYWLEEAYGTAIADADTGLIARNQGIARKLSAILYFCFEKDGRYLDAAGGYGMLTRLMRDVGFDFYWHDEYCQNLFAKGFDADKLTGPVTAVTAFEVLEHVEDPVGFLKDCLDKYSTSSIILSTETFAGPPPKPGSWWYYTPETGQHISFYQEKTLEFIARELSLHLYSMRNFHLLTDRPVSRRLFQMFTGRASWFGFAWALLRMPSRTFPDHEQISQSGRENPPR